MENNIKKIATDDTEAVIVSACLLGLPTRYDGGDSRSNELIKKLAGKVIIAVCPEELGGLSTPRPCSEITGDGTGADVLDGTACVQTSSGTEVTANFIKGAQEVLRIARLNKVTKAYLKEKSPSCGVKIIKQHGKDYAGSGVTAELLKRNKIETIGVA
ncbi:Uncharacterized protein YbbK [hydrothermal vent metagenome]|uniref:Uncharacterized protein YbbK n=1 Tax=hydrothermal vent metagenome TaxID=652676 RepID=A0A3B0RMI1_9ZZZZ